MQKQKIAAIVLAGGSGTRMGSACKKQYLSLNGRPVLFYALQAFQESLVDEIILVTNEPDYCREAILQKYGLNKVSKLVAGGERRQDSVYAGLLAARGCAYVLIHDGARPFLTQDIIETSVAAAEQYAACAVGVPAKDTIKLEDGRGFAERTLPRERIWQIQTPQTFSYPLILEAYRKIQTERAVQITDDAMAVEYAQNQKVRLIMGSYDNIKLTTPEDMAVAEAFLKNK